MTAYLADVLLSLALIAGLCWTLHVLWQAARDGHARGKARVHRGTSWDCRPGCWQCAEEL